MNVQFSRSLGGFNREEVIEYIRKLTAEKSRADRDACEAADKLESAREHIDKLISDVRASDERIYNLEAEITEKDAAIERLRSMVLELSERINSVEEEKSRVLNPIRVKVGSVEAALRTMSDELTAIASRVSQAHAEAEEAVTGIDDYTNGADENGNL